MTKPLLCNLSFKSAIAHETQVGNCYFCLWKGVRWEMQHSEPELQTRQISTKYYKERN